MPEVQKRDDVEDQDHEEGRNERDTAQPREHERAVAGAGRRRGNTDNVVKSSEYLCQELDHSVLRVASEPLTVIFGGATPRDAKVLISTDWKLGRSRLPFFGCYVPRNPLQIQNKNRVKDRDQEQGDEGSDGESAHLGIADRFPERPSKSQAFMHSVTNPTKRSSGWTGLTAGTTPDWQPLNLTLY